MSELPDEVWRKILEMGVESHNPNPNPHPHPHPHPRTNPNPMRLSFKDICCISISCKRLHRLSNEPSLWSSLLSSDFPLRPITSNSSKSLYQSWYEKDKAKRSAAHARAVLRIESRVAEHSRRLEELSMRQGEELTKLNAASAELSYLHQVRQASVALNVWQPEVILGRQKQIVEQCAVPVNSRINALEMELKLCKQHLKVFEKTYRDEKRRLEQAKEQLLSMKYHPLHDYLVEGDPSIMRKRLKLH